MPLDALIVINYLNLHGASVLPLTFTPPYYVDVTGDDLSTPLDALTILNYLNAKVSPASLSVPGNAAPDLIPATDVFVATDAIAAPAAVQVTDEALTMGIASSAQKSPSVGSRVQRFRGVLADGESLHLLPQVAPIGAMNANIRPAAGRIGLKSDCRRCAVCRRSIGEHRPAGRRATAFSRVAL